MTEEVYVQQNGDDLEFIVIYSEPVSISPELDEFEARLGITDHPFGEW
jgi:hypothetical protein